MSAGQRSGPVGVGIIGAGTISAQYLEHLGAFPDLELRAIGDIVPEAAATRAQEFSVPAHGGVDVVLEDEDIEIVVNLTIPAAHADVSEQILAAGKHVWSEKPLTTDRASAAALLESAAHKGLRVGGAPDTVLGAGIQSALREISEGAIGEPRFGLALFRVPGPESWHPSPEFLFARGAGPLFDIGPYYLTSLVLAQGPVASVQAVGTQAVPTRTIGSGPKAGTDFPVEVPTQVSALLTFENGTTATVLLTFDSGAAYTAELDLTGSLGTIALPDPNVFDGASSLSLRAEAGTGEDVWQARPESGPSTGRGLGTLEMARAIRAEVPHRLTGELAGHVLDVMVSIEEAVTGGTAVEVTSSATVPVPLPADFDPMERTL
ncbi:oxidoreductase [Brachybacterium endophyticum]|uniref:Oxidoreductase n=1 Tax=Brachybacterium endophyticum TaxID=2182385 RepID=A0A2U2RIX3_9MICO|nr:Gfo/Idh/MocA family oxidoreductase [Brachybacterium endophyticum]PWH05735.1 oxidoreductase [Brachybacterium endophyticum]